MCPPENITKINCNPVKYVQLSRFDSSKQRNKTRIPVHFCPNTRNDKSRIDKSLQRRSED